MSTFKSNPPPPATVGEKLAMVYIVANALRLSFQQYLSASLFSLPPKSPPRGVLVASATFRNTFSPTNWRQHHLTGGSTSDTYKKWINEKPQKDAGYKYEVEDISSEGMDTRIMWIGKPTAKKIIMYIHGGGFVLPIATHMLQMARYMREESEKASGQEVAVAVVEYYCAPAKQFPTPMHQGVLALNHLLAKGIAPSNISFMGDSAGGHCTMSILSHILHPYPGVPHVSPISEPFASAILLSPWVCMDTSFESFKKFSHIDYITPELGGYWAECALGKGTTEAEVAAGRFHAEAMKAPEEWWNGLDRIVKFVGITVGAWETLSESIYEFAKRIEAGSGTKVELVTGEQEVHDQPPMDFLKKRPAGVVTLSMAKWLSESFRE